MQEGISYRIRIDFHVQREIVTGLKYIQRTYRKGIQGKIDLLAVNELDYQQLVCYINKS